MLGCHMSCFGGGDDHCGYTRCAFTRVMPRASTNGANCDVNGEVGCDVKRDVNGVADAIEKLRRSRSISEGQYRSQIDSITRTLRLGWLKGLAQTHLIDDLMIETLRRL